MKVSPSSALSLVLLLVACSNASPLFGTGGMMKRKFPGASEMSYRTYREIANSRAASVASGIDDTTTGGAAVVPRTGGSEGAQGYGGSGSGGATWMFGSNKPGAVTQTGFSYNQQQPSFDQQQPSSDQQQPSFNQQQPSSNQQQPSFNQQQPSFNQQQPSFNQQGLSFPSQDSHDSFQGRYPPAWDPQDSYAYLQFPHHAPAPLDYDDAFVSQKKIYRHYY